MTVKDAKELLEGVLGVGKMTAKAKEDIQAAYDMLREEVEEQETIERIKEIGLSAEYTTVDLVEDLERAVNIFNKHTKTYARATEDAKIAEEGRQDILHDLEFFYETLTPEEIKQNTDDVVKLSRHRRLAKEYVELARPIMELAARNAKIAKELQKCSQQVRDIQNYQSKRTYHPKRIKTRAEAFQQIRGEKAPVTNEV